VLLLIVALAAAYVAAQKVGRHPVPGVGRVLASPRRRSSRRWCWASSGSGPPALPRSLGMIAGLGVTFYYMVTTQPWMRGLFGVTSPVELWWGIQPISAGMFGVPIGFAVIILREPGHPGPEREDPAAGRARALPQPEDVLIPGVLQPGGA
jgi:cation/acetate symporter